MSLMFYARSRLGSEVVDKLPTQLVTELEQVIGAFKPILPVWLDVQLEVFGMPQTETQASYYKTKLETSLNNTYKTSVVLAYRLFHRGLGTDSFKLAASGIHADKPNPIDLIECFIDVFRNAIKKINAIQDNAQRTLTAGAFCAEMRASHKELCDNIARNSKTIALAKQKFGHTDEITGADLANAAFISGNNILQDQPLGEGYVRILADPQVQRSHTSNTYGLVWLAIQNKKSTLQ